jgi:hypothetical protein
MNLRALWRPWWIEWEPKKKNNPMRKALTETLHEMWTAKLKEVAKQREVKLRQLADLANRPYHTLMRVLSSKEDYESQGGAPLLYLYTLTDPLGMLAWDVLPSNRELYTKATKRLIEVNHAAVEIQELACAAYVEYHFQQPDPRSFGDLDWEAVQRVYRRFADKFENADETGAAIIGAARLIDSIFYSL